MAAEALEQILEFKPGGEQTEAYSTIDVYTNGLTAMYTGLVGGGQFGGGPGGMGGHGGGSGPFHKPFLPYGQATLNDYGFSPMGSDRIDRDPYGADGLKQTTLNNYGAKESIPEIKVESYNSGMSLDGGFKLSGSRSTAVIHDPVTGVDIHHHSNGGGSLNFCSKRIEILSWKPKKIY